MVHWIGSYNFGSFWIDTDFSWNWIGQAFFVRFRKTQDLFQNSRLKTQGRFQKLNVPEVFQ